jgi:isovaleryl-CoA dehydrogenase
MTSAKYDSNILDLLANFDASGVAALAYKSTFDFALREIAPENLLVDKTNKFPKELWRKMGEQQVLTPRVEEKYQGAGMSFLQHTIITNAISYHSGSVALSQLAHADLCTGRIIKWGSDKHKDQYVPGLCDGSLVGALAMSEPEAGSDVGSMKTRAEKVDGGWKITGEKTWITNGTDSDVLVLYAKTKENKITAFVVEPKKTKGFRVENKIDKIGMRGSETATLVFDECFVPDDAVLGTVDKGFNVLMDGLNTERIVLSAAALGLAQASLDYTIDYVSKRKQFGKPIAAFQKNAFDIADAQSAVWSAENSTLLYANAYDRDASSLTNPKAASAFLEAGKAADLATSLAVELCGGMGYTKDLPVGQNMLDAKLYLIGGGAMNIRREILARYILPAYAQHAEWERQALRMA